MKAYIIDPPFETYGREDRRTSAALELITDLVFGCLRGGGDIFQFSVVWADPGDEPGGVFHDDLAKPHVFRLETDRELREWLRKSVDPNQAAGGTVRSIATCRCAAFGYDGQAILCLSEEDDVPVSPDTSLAVVEERPELLADNWFDGWAGI